MNEKIAKATIEDHKYLLESVDNRAAIAYFAVANRNFCLFAALKSFLDTRGDQIEASQKKEDDKGGMIIMKTTEQNKKEVEAQKQKAKKAM